MMAMATCVCVCVLPRLNRAEQDRLARRDTPPLAWQSAIDVTAGSDRTVSTENAMIEGQKPHSCKGRQF